jgi:O-antigen/teichoic acid export membrane protein
MSQADDHTDVPTLRRKLFSGTVVGFLRMGLAVPVYLTLTPLMLNTLGTERFGLWSFSTMMVSALNMMDFGLKSSLVYHVARLRDDRDAVARHFTTTAQMYLVISSCVVFAALLWHRALIENLLQIPSHLFEEAKFLLIVTVVAIGVRMMAIPYQGVLEGFQELSLSQSVFAVWLFVYSIAISIALIVRPDIYGLSCALLFSNLFILFGFYGVARCRLPFLRLTASGIKADGWGNLLRYGVGIQLATAAIALREPLFKIVLARTYDLSTVAAFEIAYRLCTQLTSIIATPLLGVLGVTALLSQRHEDLIRILRPLFSYGVIVLPPAVIFAHTFTKPLFNLWLGQKGSDAANLFPFLFLGFSIYYSTEVFYKSIEGSGRSWYSGILQVSVLALQVSLLASFTSIAWSVAGSLLIGFGIFSLSNIIMFRRCYGSMNLFPLLPAAGVSLVACAYASVLPHLPPGCHMWAFGVYLGLHLAVLNYWGVVTAQSVMGLVRRIGQADMHGPVISK